MDKERREKNIIIKGLHETDREGDIRAFERIFRYLGCGRRLSEIVSFDRIGSPRQGRRSCRLLIINFSTAAAPFELVSKAPRLANDSLLGSLYIQNDLSREERESMFTNRRRNNFRDASAGAGLGVGAGVGGMPRPAQSQLTRSSHLSHNVSLDRDNTTDATQDANSLGGRDRDRQSDITSNTQIFPAGNERQSIEHPNADRPSNGIGSNRHDNITAGISALRAATSSDMTSRTTENGQQPSGNGGVAGGPEVG